MEQFTQALWGLAAAVVSAAGLAILPLIRAYFTNLVQQRLGDGAARVAGEIAAVLNGDPEVEQKLRILIAQGADLLMKRFPGTAPKVGDQTLQGMIRGELGKLGVALPAVTAATQFPTLRDRA